MGAPSVRTISKARITSHPSSKMSSMFPALLLAFFVLNLVTNAAIATELRPGFYAETCPDAEFIVRDVIKGAMTRDQNTASVMRLQFHDCIINGCDASLLLDDTPKLGLININSLRSFEVVDEAKEALESVCPGVVSCADIVIMAARDTAFLTGGPSWEVKLGRLDSLTASQVDPELDNPRANASALIDLFSRFNLSVKDLVALSGAHSIGNGRCFSIMSRLYNQSGTGLPDPAMEPSFREKLNKLCPLSVDQNVTVNMDATPQVFDNQYYKDLANGRGFLHSDQTLYTSPQTRPYAELFQANQKEFFDAFVEGMIKLGDLQSGRPGEIRRNCRVVNSSPAIY